MIPGERPSTLRLWIDLEMGVVLKSELVYRSENRKKGIGRGGRRPKKEMMPA
jgi:hypothetical protein